MGKLDEISAAIGELRAAVKARDRADDERHRENRDRLDKIEERQSKVEHLLEPVVKTVESWQPIIDGVRESNWKWAGGLIVICALTSAIGWLVWAFAGKIIMLVASLFATR